MSTTLLDPEARIAKLLDSANYELLLPRTDCGMVAATGLIKGNKVVVFASDPTIKGGALGIEGSQVIGSLREIKLLSSHPIPQLKVAHLVSKVRR